MHRAHAAVAAEDERGREGVEVLGLRHLRVELVGLAGQQHRVLEALTAVLLVEGREERRLVVAVGARTAADVHEHHFAAEGRVGVAHGASPHIREAELEGLGRILHARVQRRVGGRADAGRPRRRSPRRYEGRLAVLCERQGAVGVGRDLEAQWPRAREVAQHEAPLAPAADERAGVAVHAQDRGFDAIPDLGGDEAPCHLALAVRGPSLVTAVDVMRRSPLKNDPCSPGPAAATSKGNGTSRPFTTTTPSHRPTSEAGWAPAGLAVSAASPARRSTAADRRTVIALLIARTP